MPSEAYKIRKIGLIRNMVVLSASGLKKSYILQEVIKDASFSINEGDKVGVLGVNGAGKTTLFKMICGMEQPDEGEIYLSSDIKVAYMQQHSDYISSKSAIEDVLEVFSGLMEWEKKLSEMEKRMETEHDTALINQYNSLNEKYIANGGLTYRSRARSALIGLGFSEDELDLKLSNISGGQRTRVLLAKLLLGESKLLLLDEPTNHLDIKATQWLEEFLQSYRGTVMVISHDRFFLDAVCNKTFEIRNAKLYKYNGNYSFYIKQKEIEELTLKRDYDKKKREIERLEGIIEQQKRWNREKNLVTARSKQKAIERIEAELVEPDKEPEEIKFTFKAAHGAGNDIVILEDVEKNFETKPLFTQVNMHIRRGEHVFLLGDNGTGKSTLVKMIMGELEADSGEITIGSRVKIGYFDQAQSDFRSEKTVLDCVYDAMPELDLGVIRGGLAAFLFKGDDVFKKVNDLSGGERARIALVRLMLSRCNFLILDEPTNHLDIASKEALEKALADYDGTMLIISHDRYFINKLADRIFNIENGTIKKYDGNYDYFRETFHPIAMQIEKPKPEKKENEYIKQKERAADMRKLKAKIGRTEKRIEELEQLIADNQEKLQDTGLISDYQAMMQVTEDITALEAELAECYETWEKDSAKLEVLA